MTAPALVGRTRERARLDALLAAAAAGRGGSLLVRGEPGIGKSTLLAYARSRALAFQALAARGVESESRLAFAGLGDLLRPALDRLDGVPEVQRAALRAALALGPAPTADRFAAYSGALSLMEGLASQRPLLVLVDDAHWLDMPTREALAFCARRLEGKAALVLVASRERPPERLDLPDVRELELGGLPEEAARELLARAGVNGMAPQVAERILAAAAGNPLALLELPRLLSAEQREGRGVLPEPIRVGEAVVGAFRSRVERLPAPARAALVLAAVSDDGALGPLSRALRRRGRDIEDLMAAERAGLVAIEEGSLRLRHPLLRSVVLELADPPERRAAHRALAAALEGGREGERRAWHLAEAAVGVDERAASALEEAGARASERTGYAVAATALERAAVLSPEPGLAAARRLAAARAAQLAGRWEWALALLETAAEDAATPLQRAAIAHLRGTIGLVVGPLDLASALLREEGELVRPLDPARGARMLGDAVLTCIMAGRYDHALETARRALESDRQGSLPQSGLHPMLGTALVLAGQARRGRAFLRRAAAAAADFEPLDPTHRGVLVMLRPLAWVECFDAARDLAQRAIDAAREAGAIGLLGMPLALACEIDYRVGRWREALEEGRESVRLLRSLGQTGVMGLACVNLARVEAAVGLADDCRDHLATASDLAGRLGVGSIAGYRDEVLGRLALSEGDLEGARGHLERLAARAQAQGLREPATLQWQPDLVEVYARLGRMGDARRALAQLAEQAERSGGSWGRAVTRRGRGLIDPDFAGHFERALALHAQTPTPFERARSELCYGARLRRAGHRAEARVQLARALATFEELGAAPWSAQAREEVAASGLRLGPRRAGARERLSPRELQVARAVAEGATNREAAARLFVSEKTIERHLGSVYRKLGLRSRTALARHFARVGEPAALGPPA